MTYVLTTSAPAEDRTLVAASKDGMALMTRAAFVHADQIGTSLAREKPLTWYVSQECCNAAWEAYDETAQVTYRIEAVEER